jgi:hypothetical protein
MPRAPLTARVALPLALAAAVTLWGAVVGLPSAASAAKALPVLAFPSEPRPRPGTADLVPEVPREDEYAESINLTAWLADRSRLSVVMAVSNIGIGSGNAALKAVLFTPDGQRIAFSDEHKHKWKAQAEPFSYTMGGATLTGTLSRLVLTLVGTRISGRVVFQSELPPYRPGAGRVYYGGPPGGKDTRFFDYLAVMPRARTSGQISVDGRLLSASGRGFIERSRVTLYPFEQSARWRSFKFYQGDRSLVMNWFRASSKYGGREVAWLILGEKGRIIWQTRNVRLRPGDERPDASSGSRYEVPWSFDLGAGGEPGLTGTVKALSLAGRDLPLSDMTRLRRMFVSRYTRPLGYAQRCGFDLTFTQKSARVVPPPTSEGATPASSETPAAAPPSTEPPPWTLKGDDGECWQSFLK